MEQVALTAILLVAILAALVWHLDSKVAWLKGERVLLLQRDSQRQALLEEALALIREGQDAERALLVLHRAQSVQPIGEQVVDEAHTVSAAVLCDGG